MNGANFSIRAKLNGNLGSCKFASMEEEEEEEDENEEEEEEKV